MSKYLPFADISIRILDTGPPLPVSVCADAVRCLSCSAWPRLRPAPAARGRVRRQLPQLPLLRGRRARGLPHTRGQR